MGSVRQDLPIIPLDSWRAQAACASRVSEKLWDDYLEGETQEQTKTRHQKAKAICRNECPVRGKCSNDVDWRIDEGVRGGHVLPALHTNRSRHEEAMFQLLKKGYALDDAARLVG